MLQRFFGFSCCGRDGCGTGAKASSVTVLRRNPYGSRGEAPRKAVDAKIVVVEPELAILEEELSDNLPYKERFDPLPRWGSFSDNGDESNEDNADFLADKSSLDYCALALKRSATKARLLAEQDANAGTGQLVLPSLRSAEHSCALLAASHSHGHAASTMKHVGHLTAHGNSPDGPKISWRTTGQPDVVRQQSQSSTSTVASDGSSTEPAGIHKHARLGCVSDSDGDLSDYDGVNNRYSSQNVHTMIHGLRERMAVEGIQPPSARLPRSAAKRNKELQLGPSHRDEVQSYQAVMRSKFEALGVPEAEKDVFVDTALPSMAVRDAVTKYHTHCRDMNRYYAMPGEESKFHLKTEDRLKLDHYVQDLQSKGHVNSPSFTRR